MIFTHAERCREVAQLLRQAEALLVLAGMSLQSIARSLQKDGQRLAAAMAVEIACRAAAGAEAVKVDRARLEAESTRKE